MQFKFKVASQHCTWDSGKDHMQVHPQENDYVWIKQSSFIFLVESLKSELVPNKTKNKINKNS